MAPELYVGYAQLIVAADTPTLFLASAVAVTIALAATGALVVPGLWLMTSAPVTAKLPSGPLPLRRQAAAVAASQGSGTVENRYAGRRVVAHPLPTARPSIRPTGVGVCGRRRGAA